MIFENNELIEMKTFLKKCDAEVLDIATPDKKLKEGVNLEVLIDVKDEITDLIKVQFSEKIKEINIHEKKILTINVHYETTMQLSKKMNTKELKKEEIRKIVNSIQPFATEMIASISLKMGRTPLILPSGISLKLEKG